MSPATAALTLAWRDAALEAREAYRLWSRAPAHEKRCAYAVYVAAADREAAAQSALARGAVAPAASPSPLVWPGLARLSPASWF